MPPSRPIEVRFSEKYTVNKETGCWEWTGTQSRGYGYISRTNLTPIAAHKFSFQHFVGPIPKGKLVLHRCNNALCVNPEHLRLGTHSDNMADMREAGRRIGRNAGSRLSAKKLQKTAALLSEGKSQKEVARLVGVHRTTIQRLLYSGNLELPPREIRKLTDDQKRQILMMLKCGATVSATAAAFDVDRKTIRNIRNNAGG